MLLLAHDNTWIHATIEHAKCNIYQCHFWKIVFYTSDVKNGTAFAGHDRHRDHLKKHVSLSSHWLYDQSFSNTLSIDLYLYLYLYRDVPDYGGFQASTSPRLEMAKMVSQTGHHSQQRSSEWLAWQLPSCETLWGGAPCPNRHIYTYIDRTIDRSIDR